VETNRDLSRRQFLSLAGGVAALATLGPKSLSATTNKTKPKAQISNMKYEDIQTDVLVIGGGMAGLFASVKAHDGGAKVLMVSKGRLGSSGQTPFAKGIFSYDEKKEKLSIDEFVEKVSRSSLGTSNKAYTKQVAEHSKKRVEELKQWGFFDSALYNKAFLKPIEERNIPLLERIMITNLLKEDGKIAGAVGFSLDEEKIVTIKAKSVVLCTGAGGFKPNGFPICDLTHDGTIMAYNIGAKVTGKEWNDGHPGSLKNSADSFGNWHGMFEKKPETTSIEVHHDLGMDLNYMAYETGGKAQMGPPGMQTSNIKGGPYVPEEFKRQGMPGEGDRKGPPPQDGERAPGMSQNPVGGSSAGLAIHKSEGLVPINDKCESTIKGLYAAGDALGSYMSGGIYTQIGSSLAGSAVQGAIAGLEASKYSKSIHMPKVSKEKIAKIQEEILAPLKRGSGYSPAWVTQTLQGIMIPNFVLYIKKETMLKASLLYVEELLDHHLSKLKANSMHELRLAHETKNMVISAQMKLKASLMRKESRCSHYRLDYPNVDNKNWQAWINIYKDKDGQMAFEKQPFGTWTSA
jgi:succinate dehydrogenase/fumarate reductase flavoprotein subunit